MCPNQIVKSDDDQEKFNKKTHNNGTNRNNTVSFAEMM